MAKLAGTVRRLTYRNSENGYSVLKILPLEEDQAKLFDREKDSERLITVVGVMPDIQVDDAVSFEGRWGSHPKHGENFEVTHYFVKSPTTLVGLERFLASDHIKGVGKAYANEIIKRFGDRTHQVLSDSPEELAKIKGITLKKAREIGKQWAQAQKQREQMIRLQGIGATPNLAAKIIKAYGVQAVEAVERNPYQLATDIWGVGFTTADQVAQNLGFEQSHPHRVQAGIRYALSQALEAGHLYLPHEELVGQASRLIQVNPSDIEGQIKQLLADGGLVDESGAIFLRVFYHAEANLAYLINEMTRLPSRNDRLKRFLSAGINWDEVFAWVASRQGFELNAGQQQTVKVALTTRLSVLTGGPGTGKSTVVNALVDILKTNDFQIVLAAPTGRAAKRMTELSGHPASTIHRLLKLKPGATPQYHQDHPIPADLIVVDEASMLDVLLAEQFFSAVGPGTHVLLVGDVDQLPSVQAGNVLGDIVESNMVPVVQLTRIFRQTEESAIIKNAHRINNGQFPQFSPHPTDFYFFQEEDTQRAGDRIIELVTERIPGQFGFDPREEIQVLSPLYKTGAGVTRLNLDLQRILNPAPPSRHLSGQRELNMGSRVFRVGDRVMQLSNNYEKEVFNGEAGKVVEIGNGRVRVQFDEKLVEYKVVELDQLTLAYAVSVHKSQGSEYPAVVIPVLTAHYIMLQRNLLYTAITRAKKLVILVGSKKAIWIAIRNDKTGQRYSKLKERLQKVV